MGYHHCNCAWPSTVKVYDIFVDRRDHIILPLVDDSDMNNTKSAISSRNMQGCALQNWLFNTHFHILTDTSWYQDIVFLVQLTISNYTMSYYKIKM